MCVWVSVYDIYRAENNRGAGSLLNGQIEAACFGPGTNMCPE